MPSVAKIKSLVPYFGAKRAMAADIVQEFGKHRAYYGLCCGSLAVEFAKPVSSHETVVDLNWHVTNLARVLQERATAVELYDRLQRVICSEEIFERARAVMAEHPMLDGPELGRVDLAYHYFLTSWIGRNGVTGTKRINYQMAVRWTPGGGHGGIRFRSAVQSIPWFHRRLQSIIVLRRNIWDVLPKIEDVDGVVIYVDPPYFMQTRGGCEYVHEFEDLESLPLFPTRGDSVDARNTHEGLATELRRFERARVVVSYYDHPRIADLYPGWTVRKLYRQKNLHVQNRRGAGECEAPEVLIINGPSFAAAA